MIVIYNWGTKLKIDKELRENRCGNCRHHAKRNLIREIFVFKLFFIPIIYKVKRRGIMCSHCGKIEKLNKEDYNNAKTSDTFF